MNTSFPVIERQRFRLTRSMPTHPFSPYFVLSFFCFALVFGRTFVQDASLVLAQDSVEESPQAETVHQRFVELVREQKENAKKIDHLLTTMPIGFVEKQQEHRNKIAQLRKRNQELVGQIQAIAVQAVDGKEALSPELAQYLTRLAEMKMSGKDPQIAFDPPGARRIIRKLLETDSKQAVLAMMAYRVEFLNQDFVAAGQWVKRAAQAGYRMDARIEAGLKSLQREWVREQEQRAAEAETDDLPRVQLETDAGKITIELFENQASNSVAQFLTLVDQGFYDGLDFFQVSPTQYARAGCPHNDGTGDPGYRIASEADRPEARKFFTGTVGLFIDDQGSAGSQFFIAKQPLPFLNGRHTAIGRVIDGMSTVYKIQVIQGNAVRSQANHRPTRIARAIVLRKREHEYQPVKLPADAADGGGDEHDSASDDSTSGG